MIFRDAQGDPKQVSVEWYFIFRAEKNNLINTVATVFITNPLVEHLLLVFLHVHQINHCF